MFVKVAKDLGRDGGRCLALGRRWSGGFGGRGRGARDGDLGGNVGKVRREGVGDLGT